MRESDAAGSVPGEPVRSPRASWMSLEAPEEFVADGAPFIETEEVAACPVCGSRDFSQHAVGFDYELRTCANPWRFVECDACSHVWLNPRPAVKELPVIYPPHYYAYNYEKQSKIALRGKAVLDTIKFRGIVGACGRAPASYLDIGCGDGRFLELMHARGIAKDRCFGLELSDPVIGRLRSAGFAAHNERVETFDGIEPGSLDLATIFHVIEHVDDPRAVARRVAGWLAPGGVFAVETPNLDALDHRLFRRTYWGGYHIPRHWNMFRVATLRRLLEDAGLEVVGIRFQTGHSFWMYSFHHWTRYHGKSRPRRAELFNPFGGLLPVLLGVTAFDKARALLGLRTSSMLMLARKPSR